MKYRLFALPLTFVTLFSVSHASPLALKDEMSFHTHSDQTLSLQNAILKNKILIERFNQIARGTPITPGSEIELHSLLEYAKSEISNQTGESGYLYRLCLSYVKEIESLILKKKYKDAADLLDSRAGNLLSIANKIL